MAYRTGFRRLQKQLLAEIEQVKTDVVEIQETGGGGGGVATLVEVNHSLSTLMPNIPVSVSLPVGYNKYDVRTLYAKSSSQNISISLYDKASNGFKAYESNTELNVYDILNIPLEDKDGTNSVHLVVVNKGSSATNVDIKIKITNLV